MISLSKRKMKWQNVSEGKKDKNNKTLSIAVKEGGGALPCDYIYLYHVTVLVGVPLSMLSGLRVKKL